MSQRERDETMVDEATLQAFVDGALDLEERRKVLEFLSRNPAVTERVDAYFAQTSALRYLVDELDLGDSRNFCPDLQVRLAAAREKPNWQRVALPIAAAVTLVLTAGIGGVWLLPESHEEHASVVEGAGIEAEARVLEEAMVVDAPARPRSFGQWPPVADAELAEGDAPVAWLTAQMVGHSMRKPQLDELGLRFIGGTVLTSAEAPAIQLVYQDEAAKRVLLYAGLLPLDSEPAFTVVPEGHLSLHWHRGPLLFALIAPIDSPRLGEIVQLIGDGVASSAAAPVETASAGKPKVELRAGAALTEGPLLIPSDSVAHRLLVPMPRPNDLGLTLGGDRTVPPVQVGPLSDDEVTTEQL